MRNVASLLFVATMAACVNPPAPPPTLSVTSPERGTVQDQAGQVTVSGSVAPGPSGAAVATVTVDGVAARLAPDGSFTATVNVPAGLDLINTVATASDGGIATDTRAVQAGAVTPVGSTVTKAVTAALSPDTFAKLSAAAGPLITSLDLPSLLAPMQPIASLGDDLANVQLSVTKLGIGNAKVSLTPTAGGLQFSVELDGIDVGALAVSSGTLISAGSTTIGITADSVTVSGVLNLAANGSGGFTTTIASPNIATSNLNLNASGLAGQILSLLTGSLGSTIGTIAQSSAQLALQPLIGSALGTLAGPQHLNVLGHEVDITASPSAIAFTAAGATVTIDLAIALGGGQASPGYVSTRSGMPTLDPAGGIQLALADDLINEMTAEMLAAGTLDIKMQGNYDIFDTAELHPLLAPMIGTGSDGKVRLVLGDMMATLTSHGQPVATAAVNAQVDVAVAPGGSAQQIALEFGQTDLALDVIDVPAALDGEGDIAAAIKGGINVQLGSLSQFLVDVPVPSVAGLTLGNLSLHGDSGYAVVAGQVQ